MNEIMWGLFIVPNTAKKPKLGLLFAHITLPRRMRLFFFRRCRWARTQENESETSCVSIVKVSSMEGGRYDLADTYRHLHPQSLSGSRFSAGRLS